MNTDIDILLAKYFSGEASAIELERLDDWLAQSQANEDYFEQMSLLFQKTVRYDIPSHQPDVNKAWAMFEQHIQNEDKNTEQQTLYAQPKSRKRSLRLFVQIAAVFIAFVAVSLFFYSRQAGNQNVQVASAGVDIEHTLPDNTVVYLSANSEIAYNNDYGKTNRTINLKGKGRFDVTDDGTNKGKLLINADDVIIEDIGTVFTVDAYTYNTQITVNVESGKVLFYTADNAGLELEAGETGHYDKLTRMFEKQKHTSGKSMIVFDATPLSAVVAELSNRFGVSIHLQDNSLASRQITVSFDADDDIEEILQIIAETLQLTIHITIDNKGEVYILSNR